LVKIEKESKRVPSIDTYIPVALDDIKLRKLTCHARLQLRTTGRFKLNNDYSQNSNFVGKHKYFIQSRYN